MDSTPEELMNRGAEAEAAKPYIESVVKGAKDMILDRLINLAPDETMLFTVYRSQIICFDDILTVVEADIMKGREAIEIIQGETSPTKGIL